MTTMRTTAKQRNFHFDPVTGQIHLLGRIFTLPRSRGPRIAVGIALVIGGLFGFLPVLGFWMVPVGLLVLSQDFAIVRRWRRSLALYVGRKWGPRRTRIDPEL
jgi:hypothetical protein